MYLFKEKKKKKHQFGSSGVIRPPSMDIYDIESDNMRGNDGADDDSNNNIDLSLTEDELNKPQTTTTVTAEGAETKTKTNQATSVTAAASVTVATASTAMLEKSGEFRRSNLEAYENEIFYHVPNKLIGSPHVSSAF